MRAGSNHGDEHLPLAFEFSELSKLTTPTGGFQQRFRALAPSVLLCMFEFVMARVEGQGEYVARLAAASGASEIIDANIAFARQLLEHVWRFWECGVSAGERTT
jgi:hypothetical protein